MKAACLACQAHIRTIEGMQLTIERLLKENASIRNEALEAAAKVCNVDGYSPWEILGGADGIELCQNIEKSIRNLKE